MKHKVPIPTLVLAWSFVLSKQVEITMTYECCDTKRLVFERKRAQQYFHRHSTFPKLRLMTVIIPKNEFLFFRISDSLESHFVWTKFLSVMQCYMLSGTVRDYSFWCRILALLSIVRIFPPYTWSDVVRDIVLWA